MTTTKKCEFCDKRGLPLLLVRDGVSALQSHAPVSTDAAFKVAAKAAFSTKRLIRSGYINVHDDARKRWETYFVTPDGYFFKLLQTPGVKQVLPTKPFNCREQGHRAIASCITVPDPKNATKVWIGFSDVLWTDAVRKAHDDPAYRKRHMVEIDVQAALGGAKPAHTRPIAQAPAIVAEYAMEAKKGEQAFGWNPFVFSARHGEGERLVHECEAMRPGKGLVVTVPDPAGTAQELAMLMKHYADVFASDADMKRKLAASNAIQGIERAVRVQSELGEISGAEKMANDQISGNPLGHLLFESTRKRTEDLRHVTEAEIQRASNYGWKKYAKKFNNSERAIWQKGFDQKLQAHATQYIAPLAHNHAELMKSAALATYFECNYDRRHPESGAVYTTVLTHCISSTQDKSACSKLYDEWLKGGIDDPKNLLLQAMVLNQKAIADAVKGATTVSIDLRQIPWDNLFSTYTTSVERLAEGGREAAALLIVQIAGPVARMFGKVMDGSTGFRAAVMATGLISGHPVIICDIVGGKKVFRAQLIRELVRASGQTLSANQMKSAVAAELKRQQVHGVPMEGTNKRRWVMLADVEMIRRAPANLNMKQRAAWLAQSIKTVEAVDALNLSRWRTVINSNVRFGIVAGILQAASLTKLVADEEKSLANDNFDAKSRLYAGITAFAATTSEVMGHALRGRVALGMRFGQGLASTSGKLLRLGGRWAGVLAGLVVAGLDARKAYIEAQENASGLVIGAYVGSAVVGFALSAALLLGASIPIIGLLVLLLIGIGILIEYIKDNPVQDWLERCPWGSLPAQRYSDMATEQAQLAQALK
jgi:hypothetical protein